MKIKVWLVLLVLIFVGIFTRLYRISTPLVDRHNFRQTDTLVISKKLFSGEASFFAPRFNHAPDPYNTERYFLAEVPFYEAMVGLVSQASSSIVAIRFINILFSILISFLVFLIGKELFDDEIAGLAGAILMNFFPGFSFWGRAITPDILALFGFTLSVLASLKMQNNKSWGVILGLGYGLALLSKPSYLIFGILLIIALFLPNFAIIWKVMRGEKKSKKYRDFITSAFIAVGTPVLLLFIWRVWIALFPDSVRSDPDFLTLMHGYKGYINFWRETNWLSLFVRERLFGELLTPIGGVFASIGLLFSLKKNGRNQFVAIFSLTWLVLSVLLTTLLSWGTLVHDYYALPWVIPAALWLGLGVANIVRWIAKLASHSLGGRFLGLSLGVTLVSLWLLFGGVSWWNYLHDYADFGAYTLWNEQLEVEYKEIQAFIPSDAKVLTILEEYSPFVLNTLDREGTVLTTKFQGSCMDWQTFNRRLYDYLSIEKKDFILVDVRQDLGGCDIGEFIDQFWARYSVVYEGESFTLFEVLEPKLYVKGEENQLWIEIWNLSTSTQLEIGSAVVSEAKVTTPSWREIGLRGYVAGPFDVSSWESFKIFWENPEISITAPRWTVNQDKWVVKN